MSELMPAIEAEMIRESITGYLTTTFALTDEAANLELGHFLEDPSNGIFKGPFVRTRLPFRAADDDGVEVLEWQSDIKPYGHQLAAFRRLASRVEGKDVRPRPTLVTTGTGSGKTEAFLYPILDHVLRARRRGQAGIKALILYPMNALANDQAQRIAELLTTDPRLAGIRAAIYTGQQSSQQSVVSKKGLINDRYAIRENPPDILLTNYKMLDQLLLRSQDQILWKASAESLQYLVLDEFHTYDGAQGTDVAMLLRRLGMALKQYQDEDALTEEERSRPLGKVTPVATSATMGDEDPTQIMGFAETVFGEEFPVEAVIGETRMSIDEWIGDAPEVVGDLGIEMISTADADGLGYAAELKDLGQRPEPSALLELTLRHLVRLEGSKWSWEELLEDPQKQALVLRGSPIVRDLLERTQNAVSLLDLPDLLLPASMRTNRSWVHRKESWQAFFRGVISTLGHVRAEVGRTFVSVEVHYWLRELSRIDRTAASEPQFSWTDDGTVKDAEGAEDRPRFPAIYCRQCGRSGWMVKMNPVGEDHEQSDDTIRREKMRGRSRVRPVIHAAIEGQLVEDQDLSIDGFSWWEVRGHRFESHVDDYNSDEFRDGWIIPVLVNKGRDADKEDKEDVCPACKQADSIRFLGSRVATLLSVSLSTLFAAEGLGDEEKRALVFSDSVQDAAHRAGFIQSRAHALTMRSVLAEGIGPEEMTLEELVSSVVEQAGDDPVRRYRLLPPEVADRETFEPFWNPKGTTPQARRRARGRVQDRLSFQAALEFGTQSNIGRTLELTSTVSAHVEAGEEPLLNAVAERALSSAGWQTQFGDTAGESGGRTSGEPGGGTSRETAGVTREEQLRKDRVAWVRGVLEHIRTAGGIDHKWLERYQIEDGNRYFIWGGRNRADGMPAFPVGRKAPAFPRVGGGSVKGELDSVTTPRSWYALWTAKQLEVPDGDGGRLAAALLKELADEGLLTTRRTNAGATVYGLAPSSVIVRSIDLEDIRGGKVMLECDTCSRLLPGSTEVVDQLDGAPCMSTRCQGRMWRKPMDEGFYRTLYRSSSMRRLVAREHTGLLEDKTRLEYEDAFKSAATDPSAPNVLVATPTLEMGIDIGDLSAVYLSSLPKSVASYVQRIGRAGRLNGSSLAVTYARGRGANLQKVLDPLSVIDGAVVPPTTYLGAEEILRRQYLAAVMDSLARDPRITAPRSATQVMAGVGEDSFLGHVIEVGEEKGDLLQEFVANFVGVDEETLDKLDYWISPLDGPGTSQMALDVTDAARRWRYEVEQLNHRITELAEVIVDLEAAAEAPGATDDDKRELRNAQASRRLALGRRAELTSEYWVAVLEEYGLLPNYTLLDDTTTLGVGVSRVNPETGERDAESIEISRGSSLALRELAPGATFYTQGLEVKIDAVDLGADAEAVQRWVLCAACGYGQSLDEVGNEGLLSCPRCGSGSVADVGQQYNLVEFRRATAEVNRDEALISDREDDRTRSFFEVVTGVDLDPDRCSLLWGEEGSDLGCGYFESMTIRQINVGKPGGGRTTEIAGVVGERTLFTLCPGCGSDLSRKSKRPQFLHRAWCKYRKAQEAPQVQVGLKHTLQTQGLVLYLPMSIAMADSYAIPSLIASLQLGFSKVLGGDPEHLSFLIADVPDPSNDREQETRPALVIHDRIPGGTGYLTDWAKPENLHRVLTEAWNVVSSCQCQLDERISCESCLLPYAPWSKADQVSRAAAQRHLETLLGIDHQEEDAVPNFSTWRVAEGDVRAAKKDESVLEHRFREVLVERLKAMSMSVAESAERTVTTLTITPTGSPRRWSLKSQVTVGRTRPDFLLESSDPNIPKVAIYTDGYAFHASSAHNNVQDDAEKRQELRDQGIGVLAVTMRDVEEAEEGEASEPFVSLKMRKELMKLKSLSSTPDAFDRQGINPVDWLIRWIENPAVDDIVRAARGVPTGVQNRTAIPSAPDEPLVEVGARVLTQGVAESSGTSGVGGWVGESLTLLFRWAGSVIETALVIDDRNPLGVPEHAWREWLRMSNALILRGWPTAVSSVRLVEFERATSEGIAVRETPEPASEGSADDALPGAWQDLAEQAIDEEERGVLGRLAAAGIQALPEMGAEAVDGISLDISWKAPKVAILLSHTPEGERDELVAAGWTVLEPGDEGLVAALNELGIE